MCTPNALSHIPEFPSCTAAHVNILQRPAQGLGVALGPAVTAPPLPWPRWGCSWGSPAAPGRWRARESHPVISMVMGGPVVKVPKTRTIPWCTFPQVPWEAGLGCRLVSTRLPTLPTSSCLLWSLPWVLSLTRSACLPSRVTV